MGSQTVYIMRKSVLTGLGRRYGSVCCKVCGEPIENGDRVLSKTSKNHTKVCHEKCWEKLFIDL